MKDKVNRKESQTLPLDSIFNTFSLSANYGFGRRIVLRPIKVVLANRRGGLYWSIEELFSSISLALPTWVESRVVSAPRAGASLHSLVANLLWGRSLNCCDIVHQTGDIHYAILAVWWPPVVLTIHDLRFYEESRGLKRFLFWWIWLYLPCLRATRVTVISEFTKKRLLSLCQVNPAKIRVIPNCVDPHFAAADKPWHDGQSCLLLVGTTPNKNVDRVIRACTGLKVTLAILGCLSDDHRGELDANNLQYSEFSNLSKAAVVRLYQQADIVVFVSTYEGFGMPILEAQSVGRPVLTSNISPMCDVAGDGALKVDPFDVVSIRSGLLQLLEDEHLRKDLVQKGLRNVEAYTAESVAGQYAALYREILSNP
ncbi:MAG TPA: glycosyltransferase family 1 protein [Nitrospira sp.]|nr:glycosyltransferase family 1 protein [Nitrospira sp.]